MRAIRWTLMVCLLLTQVACDDSGGSSATPDSVSDATTDAPHDAGLDAMAGDVALDGAQDVASEVAEDLGQGPMELELAPVCVVAAGTDDGPCLKAEVLDFGEVVQGETGTAHMEFVNSGTVGAWLQSITTSVEGFTFVCTPIDGSFVVPLPAQLQMGGRLRVTVGTPSDLPLGPMPDGEVTVTLAFDSGNEQATTLAWDGSVIAAPAP